MVEQAARSRVGIRWALVASLTAGGIALAVYLATVAPSVPPGDSGNLIVAAATLGIAHPPGYPLFAMLGHFKITVVW